MAGPKEDVFDIGEFLAQQSAEGSVESQGEFTVSQEKAAIKLSRFALPFVYAWVLKIVQAAVAWESERIEVRQYRSFTVLAFCPSRMEDIPSEEALVSKLLSGRTQDSDQLGLLCMGLRALVEQAGLSFRLLIARPEHPSRPIHAGNDACALAAEQAWARLSPALGIQLMVAHLPLREFLMNRYIPKSFLYERPDLEIARVLDGLCFLCPVPLVLDGRRIDRLMSHPIWGFTSARRPVALLGMHCPERPPLKVPEEFEDKVIAINTHPRRAKRTYGGVGRESSFWMYLTASQPNPARAWKEQLLHFVAKQYQHIFFVCHGVVVDRYKIKLQTSHTSLLGIVSAQGLPTDLSGLTMSHGPALERLIRTATVAMAVRLRQLRASPESFLQDIPDTDSHGDKLDYRLAAESQEQARAIFGDKRSVLREGLAAALFAGRHFLSKESDPDQIGAILAMEWRDSLLKDLNELETIETAGFESDGLLGEIYPRS